MANSSAFLSLTEQQVMSVPVFRNDSSGRDLETTAIFDWVRKGINMPFNTFETGNRAVFLGNKGKLYEWGVQKAADGTAAKIDPKEILSAGDEWKLQTVRQKEGGNASLEEEDLSGTAIVSTETETFIVDPQMQLFLYQKGKELTRCLANRHVSQVACGAGHVLVLTTDGGVHCAGQNNHMQLGQGNNNPIPIADMKPVTMPDKRAFATYVGCGSAFSIILCNNNVVYCFGSFAGANFSGTPRQLSVAEGLRPCVKVTCGRDHALFMTAKRRLAGLGVGNRNQLGKLSVVEPAQQSSLREISWDTAAKGQIVDVFCHPRFNASVVFSSTDKFYACGEVGELLGKPDLVIDDFHHLWSTDAVVLQGTVVCMKPPTGSVRSRGFNDEDTSDVLLVPAPPSAMQDPSRDKAAEYLERPLSESHRRLCSMAFDNGKLSPQDVVKEFQGHDAQNGRLASASKARAAADETELRILLGEETIKQRSRCLKKLISQSQLEDKCAKKNGDPEHEGIKAAGRVEKRKLQISIPDPGRKFSKKTLFAYGRFLYEDDLKGIEDAPSAIDMLEFAREIEDDLGIAALSAWHAKHHINPDELASCLRKCIDSRSLPLGVILVKLRLYLENCCDVLQVAEMAPQQDPYAEYIRAMAMAFAVAHAKKVVQSPGFKNLDNVVKGKLLEKLAEADCLNT